MAICNTGLQASREMPPDAVLCGLLMLVSFFMAHSEIKVPGTMWLELWIVVAMPTGSGKTPLFILQKIRIKLNLTRAHPTWLLDECSYEKMGELMACNHSKILAMYDELLTFRGKALSESHETSTFLSLYSGNF